MREPGPTRRRESVLFTAREVLSPWFGVALALHSALLALAAWGDLAKTPPSVTSRAPGLLWLETAAEVVVDDAKPERDTPEDAASATSGTAAAAPAASTRAVARSAVPAAASSSEAGELPAREPGVAPAIGSSELDGPAPQLSLGQLGVGRENNPFLEPGALPPSERSVASQRLESSLRNDLSLHDQRLGLGPEGPAVAAVKSIVLDSPTVNTSATLRLRTDAAGRTVAVDVLDASSANDEWQRIAEQLKRALDAKKLRIAARSGGVSMTLRVVSRVQLPSGADPGLAVELFGQTLKAGDGDRSARLSLLTPKMTELGIPYTDGRHTVRVPTLNLMGLSGDLADVGRVAQRIVTAYLVAMETHPQQPKPAYPSMP